MVDWHVVDLAPQSNVAAIVVVPVDQAPRSADAARTGKSLLFLDSFNLRLEVLDLGP